MLLGVVCKLFLLALLFCVSYGELLIPSVWPQPVTFTTGSEVTVVSSKLHFLTQGGEIPTLSLAYARYHNIIFSHSTPASASQTTSLQVVKVNVEDRSEGYPQLETDESYTLSVGAEGISLSAKTIYGALHGLETLSQLIMYDFDQGVYVISATPIYVQDAPRYAHRGVLLDTSRHFQPVSFIQTFIDSLAFAKYNVFHWHVVDTQSFPFQSLAAPRLWMGAYSKTEKYSHEDIVQIVEYGRQRGVKVMIEFDMPGHASSWCTGYPSICPSMQCKQPLNPASNQTFPLITSLLGECAQGVPGAGEGGVNSNALFPYQLVHLGGDEVNYACWDSSADVQAWMKTQGYSSSEEVYKYFVDTVANIARSVNYTPIQWVEVFEHFQNTLNNDTVVHVWKEKSTLNGVLQAGYKALLSNQDFWYLDHLSTTWQDMYLNEPTEGLSADANPDLILGGESCMWGETVDPSDLMNTVWPRAAAVAEVLWSPLSALQGMRTGATQSSRTSVDMTHVESRLETFRCLLNQRGVAAAPVTNKQARYQPSAPGSCYVQRRKI